MYLHSSSRHKRRLRLRRLTVRLRLVRGKKKVKVTERERDKEVIRKTRQKVTFLGLIATFFFILFFTVRVLLDLWALLAVKKTQATRR